MIGGLLREGAEGRYRLATPPARLTRRAGHAWEQGALPALCAAVRAPLLFSPANLAPLAWPRNVVVLHDAAALRGEAWYSRSYVAMQRALVPRVVRAAVHVVTVSEFSRREIVELAGADPGRVSVVGEGVDARFSPRADADGAARALALDRPYVLTVGSATARKNMSVLARAARELAGAGVELVAAGGSEGHLKGEGRVEGLRWLGYVPESVLPGLYAGARAFVLPSRHEGFGLTCLEAMASGVPVVAARAGALPETCGDAAVLHEPDDAEGFAASLISVAGDEALRADLAARGRHRARRFTWEDCVEMIDRLLRRLAAEGG